MASKTRQQLEIFLKTIDVNCDRCLDIGNSQQKIDKRVKSFNVKKYVGLDLEKPHQGKQADIICDIQEHSDYYEIYNNDKDKFDTVFCIEVSEYWYNPFGALDNIQFLMKPGGLLYISFHFCYPQHAPKGQDMLRYTPDGAERLLKETGFEILEHKYRIAESPLLMAYYSQDKMRGIKDGSVDHNVIGSFIKCKKIK